MLFRSALPISSYCLLSFADPAAFRCGLLLRFFSLLFSASRRDVSALDHVLAGRWDVLASRILWHEDIGHLHIARFIILLLAFCYYFTISILHLPHKPDLAPWENYCGKTRSHRSGTVWHVGDEVLACRQGVSFSRDVDEPFCHLGLTWGQCKMSLTLGTSWSKNY